MKKELLKSIGAVLAGFVLLVTLSIVMDSILEKNRSSKN
jgi:hypothetical protein